MSEERKRILEMLAEGKVNVDEAERLLIAVDNPTSQKTGTRSDQEPEDDDHGFDFLGGLGQEIRAGLAEAESALEEIGPEVAAAVQGAGRQARRGFRWGSGDGRRSRSRSRRDREEVIRHVEESRPFEPGSLLSVRNTKGDVLIEKWDKDEVSLEATIVAKSRTVEDARLLAESVEIDVLNADDGLRIETHLPNEEGELRGSWEANLLIRIPGKLDLGIESRHGNTRIPGIVGDVSVRNAHGATTVDDITGTFRARQSHGNLKVGSVSADASIDLRHGHLDAQHTGGSLTLKNSHGNARVGHVGQKLDTFSAHGDVTTGSIGGDVEGRLRHCKLNLQEATGGNVILDASHGVLRSKDIGGDLSVMMRHGSIDADQVGGNVDVNGSHSPVSIRQIGKNASVKANHARVALDKVGGDVTVDSNHNAVVLSRVAGNVEIATSRGSVEVTEASGGVTIESDRGSVHVTSDGPITHDYRIVSNRGPVDLRIPDGSDVIIQGSVDRGEVSCSIPSIHVEGSSRGKQNISGELGDGSAKINLDVHRADLRLRSI